MTPRMYLAEIRLTGLSLTVQMGLGPQGDWELKDDSRSLKLLFSMCQKGYDPPLNPPVFPLIPRKQ